MTLNTFTTCRPVLASILGYEFGNTVNGTLKEETFD